MDNIERNAIISDDQRYRYWLTRRWESDAEPALFVMLNPSTADAEIDDPTIRRCMGFARSWNAGGIVVVNLYAYRATKPADLWTADEPIGELNNTWLREMAERYPVVVCAWGANARDDRVREFCYLMHRIGADLKCLGTTKSGAPRHPLYVKGDTELQRWTPAYN